jgi:hypothetical protein
VPDIAENKARFVQAYAYRFGDYRLSSGRR